MQSEDANRDRGLGGPSDPALTIGDDAPLNPNQALVEIFRHMRDHAWVDATEQLGLLIRDLSSDGDMPNISRNALTCLLCIVQQYTALQDQASNEAFDWRQVLSIEVLPAPQQNSENSPESA